MDERTPDLGGLGREVERQVAPPPFGELVARHRRRHRRRAAVGAAGLLLAVASGGLAARDALRDGTADRADVLTAGFAGDFGFTVTDVEFVSPDVGWAIGLACAHGRCRVSVRSTRDGGRTWSGDAEVAVVDQRRLRAQDPVAGGARSLRFLDERTGYAFNPGRYVTRDGGRTWRAAPLAGKVGGASAGGGEPWFLVRPCGPGDACRWQVAGAPGQPGSSGTDAHLRRRTRDVAWLLVWSHRPGDPPGALRRTADGGRTWPRVGDPCPRHWGRQLSAVGADTAWMACADEGDVAAPKRVFRTTDGGRGWEEVATVPERGAPSDLVAVSATTAYLTLVDRGHLLVTRDGGRTWRPAEGARGGYGFSNLQFVDERHGWAMGDRGVLWRTTDGLRWHRLALPGG